MKLLRTEKDIEFRLFLFRAVRRANRSEIGMGRNAEKCTALPCRAGQTKKINLMLLLCFCPCARRIIYFMRFSVCKYVVIVVIFFFFRSSSALRPLLAGGVGRWCICFDATAGRGFARSRSLYFCLLFCCFSLTVVHFVRGAQSTRQKSTRRRRRKTCIQFALYTRASAKPFCFLFGHCTHILRDLRFFLLLRTPLMLWPQRAACFSMGLRQRRHDQMKMQCMRLYVRANISPI